MNENGRGSGNSACVDEHFDRLIAYLAEIAALVEGNLSHELGKWRYEGSAGQPIAAATCQQCGAVVRVDARYRAVLEEDSVAARCHCLYRSISRANIAARSAAALLG